LNIWNKFCYIFSLLTASALSAGAQTQDYSRFQSNTSHQLPDAAMLLTSPVSLSLTPGYPSFLNILHKNDKTYFTSSPNLFQDLRNAIRMPGVLPSELRLDVHTSPQPFFCKEEYQYQKWSGIPLRLRVGSLQDCDWLEGKPNAVQP
jgi:hypothetical protein